MIFCRTCNNFWFVEIFLDLLKYGKTIQLTDKHFYRQRVQAEFRSNKSLEEKDIPFVINQGRLFLAKKNVV